MVVKVVMAKADDGWLMVIIVAMVVMVITVLIVEGR